MIPWATNLAAWWRRRARGWEEGDQVSVTPVLFCSSCRNCIAGYTNICLNRKMVGIQAATGDLGVENPIRVAVEI